jgi:CDP-6-deoxy-D-xylo-4-hexulose-3-dehydrase
MTNIAPVIQANLEPIFCDINLKNFSFDIDELKYIAF